MRLSSIYHKVCPRSARCVKIQSQLANRLHSCTLFNRLQCDRVDSEHSQARAQTPTEAVRSSTPQLQKHTGRTETPQLSNDTELDGYGFESAAQARSQSGTPVPARTSTPPAVFRPASPARVESPGIARAHMALAQAHSSPLARRAHPLDKHNSLETPVIGLASSVVQIRLSSCELTTNHFLGQRCRVPLPNRDTSPQQQSMGRCLENPKRSFSLVKPQW
jgi:hypothetical protein